MLPFSRYRAAWLGAIVICGLVLLLAASGAWAGMNEPRPDASRPKARRFEPTYEIAGGLNGDVFPVFASHASLQPARERTLGTVTVTVLNSGGSLLRNRISVQIPGWSEQEIQIAEVAAGQQEKYLFAPTFLPRLYRNRELVAATAVVQITDMAGKALYSGTVPLRIRSAEDIYWGTDFSYARFIASWVTPHDPAVESVLARAKEYMPGRRLAGYESERPVDVQLRSTLAQVRAIYNALQKTGLSYVKSSGTFGARANAEMSERIRFPQESLARVSANCIDGVVLYASLFENLGFDPVVVLIPGHSYVGVRLTENSDDYLYLETAITGRASFDVATESARRGLAKVAPKDVIRISISAARDAGIFPIPGPRGGDEQILSKSR